MATHKVPLAELDLDRVEAACRAVATARSVTMQLRARGAHCSCWFEVGGAALRAWEIRAGASDDVLAAQWRRYGVDGAQRLGIEIAIDLDARIVEFRPQAAANMLAPRAGEELARAVANALGAS